MIGILFREAQVMNCIFSFFCETVFPTLIHQLFCIFRNNVISLSAHKLILLLSPTQNFLTILYKFADGKIHQLSNFTYVEQFTESNLAKNFK